MMLGGLGTLNAFWTYKRDETPFRAEEDLSTTRLALCFACPPRHVALWPTRPRPFRRKPCLPGAKLAGSSSAYLWASRWGWVSGFVRRRPVLLSLSSSPEPGPSGLSGSSPGRFHGSPRPPFPSSPPPSPAGRTVRGGACSGDGREAGEARASEGVAVAVAGPVGSGFGAGEQPGGRVRGPGWAPAPPRPPAWRPQRGPQGGRLAQGLSLARDGQTDAPAQAGLLLTRHTESLATPPPCKSPT